MGSVEPLGRADKRLDESRQGVVDIGACMTVDFGFTADPTAITLRELQATSMSLVDWLVGWLRSLFEQ